MPSPVSLDPEKLYVLNFMQDFSGTTQCVKLNRCISICRSVALVVSNLGPTEVSKIFVIDFKTEQDCTFNLLIKVAAQPESQKEMGVKDNWLEQ